MVQDRQQAIMKVLSGKPRLAFELLQAELGVSRSTLRRDLIELEHLGEIVRRRGTVLHAEFVKGEPSFDRRRGRQVEQKQAIAKKAAALVPENSNVYLDAGTTCLEVGRLLMKRADLKLFTHSIRLIADSVEAEATIVCVGGEYRRVSDAVVGGLTAAWLDQLRFDVAFVAASGLEADGLTTTELSETLVKQQLLKRSDRRILVADAQKWGKPSVVRFAGWSELTDFVSDPALPAAARQAARSGGVRLHFS